MITDTKKNEFLGTLAAHLPDGVSFPVVHAIVHHVNPTLGIASAKYTSYAGASTTSLRTVERTISALHRHGVLQKQLREGAPALWFPALMDIEAGEALRRAGWLASRKDENPQNYFKAADGYLDESVHSNGASEQPHDKRATGELQVSNASDILQAFRRAQRLARNKSPAYANDHEILHLVHDKLDLLVLTLDDPGALGKAIRGILHTRPLQSPRPSRLAQSLSQGQGTPSKSIRSLGWSD